MWVYFWTLSSVLLICIFCLFQQQTVYLFIFFFYCSFVVTLKIGNYGSYNFILHLQDCLGILHLFPFFLNYGMSLSISIKKDKLEFLLRFC